MTTITIDNDISAERINRLVQSCNSKKKKVVIWHGISAQGNVGKQRYFQQNSENAFSQIEKIKSEIPKVKQQGEQILQQEKLKLKESIRDLCTHIFNDEHLQQGAHLESFVHSMPKIHDALKKANFTLESLVFYDTSTLHRYNRYWVKDLRPSPIQTNQVDQIFDKEINIKTLEKFDISYYEASQLLENLREKEGIPISRETTLYLIGPSWDEAYQLIKKVIDKTSETEKIEQPFKDAKILQALQEKKIWYQKAAEVFGNHWLEAYNLLKDAIFVAFTGRALQEFGITWEELQTSEMQIEQSLQPATLESRFQQWELSYKKTSKLFSQSKEKASQKLGKIAEKVAQEVASRKEIKADLEEAADKAFKLFAIPWKEHQSMVVEKTQQLRSEGVNVCFQYWKDWYQTDKGREYINKIEGIYKTDSDFKKKVHMATITRLNQVEKQEDQERKKGQLTKNKHISTLKTINFKLLSHIEGIKYILEEVARVWYLIEEYTDYNIILTYPNWELPPAVEYFLSSRGLLKNLCKTTSLDSDRKDNSLAKDHITYFGFSHKKLKSKPITELAGELADREFGISPKLKASVAETQKKKTTTLAQELTGRELLASAPTKDTAISILLANGLTETQKALQDITTILQATRKELQVTQEGFQQQLQALQKTQQEERLEWNQLIARLGIPNSYQQAPSSRKRSQTDQMIFDALRASFERHVEANLAPDATAEAIYSKWLDLIENAQRGGKESYYQDDLSPAKKASALHLNGSFATSTPVMPNSPMSPRLPLQLRGKTPVPVAAEITTTTAQGTSLSAEELIVNSQHEKSEISSGNYYAQIFNRETFNSRTFNGGVVKREHSPVPFFSKKVKRDHNVDPRQGDQKKDVVMPDTSLTLPAHTTSSHLSTPYLRRR